MQPLRAPSGHQVGDVSHFTEVSMKSSQVAEGIGHELLQGQLWIKLVSDVEQQ